MSRRTSAKHEPPEKVLIKLSAICAWLRGVGGFVQRVRGWSLRLGEARTGAGVSTCDVDLRAERRIHSNGEEREQPQLLWAG